MPPNAMSPSTHPRYYVLVVEEEESEQGSAVLQCGDVKAREHVVKASRRVVVVVSVE